MKNLKLNNHGMAEWVAIGSLLVIGFLLAGLYSLPDARVAVIGDEAAVDLARNIDALSLALGSEDECTLAFGSAPLNGIDFIEGASGTVAMDFAAFPVRGVPVVSVNDPIAGGKITKIWIENSRLSPPLGGFRHFLANLKIQGTSGGSPTSISRSLPIGLLVDAGNKVKYCYLQNSVAIKTCQAAGGVFDPFHNPKCTFNFTNSSCPDPKSCVTGISPSGDLLCSNKLTPPPPPPPPMKMCFCGCTQFTGGFYQYCSYQGVFNYTWSCAAIGWNVGDYIAGPHQWWKVKAGTLADGSPSCQIDYDLTGCILTASVPGGC